MEVTKKRICQIQRGEYAELIDGNRVSVEPTYEEAADAVAREDIEPLGFQEHLEELREKLKTLSSEEGIRWIRQYHNRHIAFFWVKGWPDEDVIKICSHDVLEDGGHRLLAAKFKGIETIDCVTVKCNKCLRG